MPKTPEDHRADEVRRRIREILQDSGVDSRRVSLEVLHMLPSEFVRQYQELTDMALDFSLSTGMGRGGDEGRIKAAGRDTRDPLSARTIRGAQTGGRKAPKTSGGSMSQSPVRSELALDEKRKLDRRLIKAVETAIGAARNRNGNSTTENSDKRGGRLDNQGRARCPECGRGMATGWVRCPYHTDKGVGNKNLDQYPAD